MYSILSLFLSLTGLLLIPLASPAKLIVNVEVEDDSTLVAKQWDYRSNSSCFGLLGCWECDPFEGIRCTVFQNIYTPDQQGDTFTFEPNQEGCLVQCLCGAKYDYSFVSLENDRGSERNYTGGFQVVADETAGTTASISCSANTTTGFLLDCGDGEAKLDWDVSSDIEYGVTVTLSLPVSAN